MAPMRIRARRRLVPAHSSGAVQSSTAGWRSGQEAGEESTGRGEDQQTAAWFVGEGAVQLLIQDLGSHVVF